MFYLKVITVIFLCLLFIIVCVCVCIVLVFLQFTLPCVLVFHCCAFLSHFCVFLTKVLYPLCPCLRKSGLIKLLPSLCKKAKWTIGAVLFSFPEGRTGR